MDKRLKHKLVLALSSLGFVLFFGMQFYLVSKATPEQNARLVSVVREIPAWIFYGYGAIITTIFLFGVYAIMNQKRWSQMAASGSVEKAKRVASSLWYVDDTLAEMGERARKMEANARALGYRGRGIGLDSDDGWTEVRFRHMWFGNWKFTLPVRPHHPDIDQFRRLRIGQTVEFEALSEGLECALDHELCGYLRIKSVS